MTRIVEGAELDLSGLCVMPGLVNAHDHLEFALFPPLGRGPYANATEWARDIYHPARSPIREHLAVPKPLRLLWGGLRNLLAGVTTVWHHNPYHPCFRGDFPVRVANPYGWAHSLAFEDDVAERWRAAPPDAPFMIHAAEGTDEEAAREIFGLDRIGVLGPRTVLVHGVGLCPAGWELIRQRNATVAWCPLANLFVLGKTLSLTNVPPGVRIALGTDSPLTADGDMLDAICAARRLGASEEALRVMTTVNNASPEDWIAAPWFGAPPQLVVIGGRIRLIHNALAGRLPGALRDEFFPLRAAGRPAVLVRWNIPRLLAETAAVLGADVRLGGREVAA